ncbi:hypothetical protein [Alteribacter populi]|uniref:hypothetical protein n=1 Tax=Alteribacter populi TaxID=2011011 RepID=UPI000BBA4A4C|nr:hypothetical protein [Alteribacter populi]
MPKQKTITLPTLPRTVADNLEFVRSLYGADNVISFISSRMTYTGHDHLRKYVDDHGPADIITALLFGYTIERTPEELVADAYHTEQRIADAHPLGTYVRAFHCGKASGIRTAVELLERQIPGVNTVGTYIPKEEDE